MIKYCDLIVSNYLPILIYAWNSFIISNPGFLIRLILTWYPKIDLNKGFWLLMYQLVLFKFTRKLIPPIGGVDVGPVIWIGIISFLREILVGQQGLIKLAIQKSIS